MNAKAVTCPSAKMLANFGDGKLDSSHAEAVSLHLESCADCRVTLEKLRRVFERRAPQQPGADQLGQFVPEETRTQDVRQAIFDATPSAQAGPPVGSAPGASSGRPAGSSPAGLTSIPAELEQHPDYELLRELGRGGMGVVYLARNRMMDRLEVLKVLSQALLDRPGARERFQQEIRLAAKLGHPNIVAAYSVLRPGELLVFAMEFVDGQDLSQVVRQRGPLPVTNATFYVHQVALGLAHAHEMGMVHRDIKPTNLMLAIKNKKHVVKILDFGLAKATSEKAVDAGLTKSGQVLGTPHYIAPEQTLNAQKADIRADIYSLGCTLYYLLAGSPPFRGDSMFAILQAHHQLEAQPLNQIRGDVPAELATVVSTMMAKDPNQQYQTPSEVAKALKQFFKAGVNVRTQPAATTDLPPSAVDEPEPEAVAAVPPEEPVPEETLTPAIPVAALPFTPVSISTPPFAAMPVATPYPFNPLDELSNDRPMLRRSREEPLPRSGAPSGAGNRRGAAGRNHWRRHRDALQRQIRRQRNTRPSPIARACRRGTGEHALRGPIRAAVQWPRPGRLENALRSARQLDRSKRHSQGTRPVGQPSLQRPWRLPEPASTRESPNPPRRTRGHLRQVFVRFRRESALARRI